MKVPISEPQVTPQAPQAPEPEAPRPLAAASGVNVAEANAGVGKAVQGIGGILAQHAETQMKWDAQVQGYQALEAYKTSMQDNEHAEGTKTVLDSNGVKVDIPLGYYDRRGLDATHGNGVVGDFNEDSSRERAAIMKTLSPMAQAHFASQAAYYTEAYKQRLVTYQAKQKDAYDTAVFDGQIKSKVSEAQSAMTPEQLKMVVDGDPTRGVDGLVTINTKLGAYRQEPPETTLVNEKKHMTDAVTASAVSVLRNTGNLEKAQTQVEAFADRLDPGDSAKLSETLERMKKSIDGNNEYHAKAAIEKNDTDFALRAVDPDPTKRPTEQEAHEAMLLGAGKDPRGISKGMYDAWKEVNKAEPLSPEERAEKVSDLADALAKITDNKKNPDPNAAFEDVAKYKALLMEAGGRKLVSPAKYEKNIALVNKLYDKGLDGEVAAAYHSGGTVWTFLKNAVMSSFGYAPHNTKPEQMEAKAFLGKAFMDKMNSGGIPEGQAHEVAQQMLSSYLASKNPDVLGAKAVPNNKGSKAGIVPLHTMQVESNSDRKIAPPKTPPAKQITKENLEYTAKLHNMTVEDVKKKLGVKDGE